MKKLIILLIFISHLALSQTNKGSCKIAKPTPDPTNKSKITFKSLSPVGKPVTSRVAFKMINTKLNIDTVIQPKIDKTGTSIMILDPSTYEFVFYMKFWYDVPSKPMILKPKTNTLVVVKFEAEEIGVSGKKN